MSPKINGLAMAMAGALMLAQCGCVSNGVPRKPQQQPASQVVLNLRDCKFDFSEFQLPRQTGNAVTNFFSALESAATLNRDSSSSNGVRVTSLRIQSSLQTSTAGSIMLAIISTPMVPFLFARNRCTAEIQIAFEVTSTDGQSKLKRQRQRRLRGWFSGWSFIRFAFRNAAMNQVSDAVPAFAAEMLLNDLRKIRTQDLLLPIIEKPSSAEGQSPNKAKS